MPNLAPNADIVFVHLSDIHFRKGHVGDAHDEELPLRRELELDLRRLRPNLPRLDALLVTGDIAFSGQKSEFEYAESWLESIAEQAGCGHAGILVIPGNHDVDRRAVPVDGPIAKLHSSVRLASAGARTQVLTEILRDAARGEELLQPLAAYNSFAAKYGCSTTREMPYWQRDFLMSDGSIFRLRGINSALISDENDNNEAHKLIYGAAQMSFIREDRVRYAVLGHHPPSWTFEGDDADQRFSTMTTLQLFGHKHSQWVVQIGQSVRLIAGAVHPSRQEAQWEPRYSVIALNAVKGGVKVRVLPRRWSIEEQAFIADTNSRLSPYRNFRLKS